MASGKRYVYRMAIRKKEGDVIEQQAQAPYSVEYKKLIVFEHNFICSQKEF